MPSAAVPRPSIRRDVWCALAVTLLAAAVRYPRLSHGLWYDEMATLVLYVQQPWSKVLAAAAGQYVPNNHVLHTVLAKLIYPATEIGEAPREALLRLPAWAAASLLPAAVAWPLRRRAPLAALAVALAVALHPWLVALGAEARGYTLMLLLGTIATNLLSAVARQGPPGVPAVSRRAVAAYAVALAAAIYTVPLAVLLVPAHAVAVFATRRAGLRSWALGAVLGLLLATAAYLPMVRGLASYYRQPYGATMTYRAMLDALPRHALAGERLPRRPADPALSPPPDPPAAAVFWAFPVLAAIVGSAVGWSRFPDARPLLATQATATVLGVLLPLAVPSAAEVRFVTWTAPWFCLAVVLPLAAAADLRAVWGRPLAAAGLAVLLALFGQWDAAMLPNQQARAALRWVDRRAPPGRPVVVAGLGADEAVLCYACDAPAHDVLPGPDTRRFAQTLAALAARSGGRLPWVVILFEAHARDREPLLWRDLTARYQLVARLPGRLTPVSVYAPREAALTRPTPTAVAAVDSRP